MTTPIALAGKDPNERYGYSWRPQVDDTISGGLLIDLTSGTATLDGSPVLIDNNTAVRFVLVGGIDGETTVVTARATMASGDIIEQTILIPIRDSATFSIEVTLQLAKQHLRVLHDDEDALITSYMNAAHAWIVRYAGTNYEATAPELGQAELLLIGFYYENRGISDDVPVAVKSLAGPFRLPTLA